MLKLEKMELHGFKSFHERTEILFDQGITAVVGPNGCGKSNILDAMVWVLGEQSVKTMRGASMVDLIFNGSQSRRPLGMAEVTLSLRATNGDLPDGMSNVALTRRLYRSGESEYALNGSICRLKDIQDILYGSGLGVKGYSVIEQGRIGTILGAKPLERRALIEEAAGITKFRVKKRQAELKLDAAQQNLLRVRDIIAELEKQMASLKRQAAKARRFERVREDLQATLLELYAREYDLLRERSVEVEERFGREAKLRAELSESVLSFEADVDNLRLNIEKQESEVRSSADRLHQSELEVDRNRNVIVGGRERLEELEGRGRELAEGLAASRARHAELEAELAAAEHEAVSAAERKMTAEAQLGEQRAAGEASSEEVAQVERQLETARAALLGSVRRVAEMANVVESSQRRIDEMERRIEELASELETATESAREAVELALERREALSEQEAAVSQLEQAVRSGFEQARECAVRRDAARTAAEQMRKQLQLKAERARALEQITAIAEDAGEAISSAVAELGTRAHGLAADYIRAEVECELAVGAALESVLGTLVLSDAGAAAEALSRATDEGRGALRLLLFDGVASDQEHPDARRAMTERGVRGVLRDYVTLVNGVGGALAPLLHRTLLIDDLDTGLRLRSTYPQLSFVTLRGEVIGADGVLRTGGRSGPGLLAVRREQRELEVDLVSLGEELEEAENALEELQVEADDADSTARAAVTTLHETEKLLLGARHRSEAADSVRDDRSEELRSIELERGVVDDELAAARERLEQELAEQRQSDEDRVAVEAAIAAATEALLALRTVAVERSRALMAAESEFARSEEADKASRAQVARLGDAVRERAAEMKALEQDRAATLARSEALIREVENAEEELTGLLAEVAALKDQLQMDEDRARQSRHELGGREGELRELRLRDVGQREMVQAIEIERTRIEADLERMAERCREDLGEELDQLHARVAAEAERQAERDALDAELQIDDGDGDEGSPDEVGLRPRTEVATLSDGDAGASSAGALATDSDDAPAPGVDGDDGPLDEVADGSSRHLSRADLVAASVEELRRRADALKRKLHRLGPVNELAIHEYEELRTRYEFLTGQVGDLTDSIESLHSTISRINRTSRERFKETFIEVNRNFQDVYVRLFGGGRAELRLTDEENLLETGIDIVAQPPGKRLQNILLLSGGEKALTAISLLFALFQYKPSPFCILDEVDAPLDEKNIDRFVDLVRGLRTGTQFILITHSPRTMKVADTLYGVTMEEPGCSRVVSVDLKEAG